MAQGRFPALDAGALAPTRDALHAYARVLGSWASACRRRRRHWSHLSLRPSLHGLTTGVIRGEVDFELELDLAHSQLHVRLPDATETESLTGQPASRQAEVIRSALWSAGVKQAPARDEEPRGVAVFPNYAPPQAGLLHGAIGAVTAALEDLRAGLREETSPIQLWPHHFDLAMLWLPGAKVPGEDPADEDRADVQMNFGFVPGDESIPEPYFYVTAYPLPAEMPRTELPAGAVWRTEGFNGAVLPYGQLSAVRDPAETLQELWLALLGVGRQHLCQSEGERVQ